MTRLNLRFAGLFASRTLGVVHRLVFPVGLTALTLFAPSFARAVDGLVINGGFQSGLAPWWGQGAYALVQMPSAEDGSAVQLANGLVVQDKIPVVAGQRYRISMQVRGDEVPDGSVFVQLSYRGEAGLPIKWWGPGKVVLSSGTEPALLATGSGDWRSYSLVVEAPALANQMLLYLRKKEGTPGYAYFDSVSVTATSDPATTAPESRRIELAAALFSGPEIGTPLAGTSGTLASSGIAYSRVYASPDADVVTLGAVNELTKSLGKVTGASFLPVAKAGVNAQWPLLVVGKDAAVARGLVSNADFASLGEDGFLLRRIGKDIVLAGGTPRGTLYAVNWFLDRKAGIKWLAPDVTYVPSQPNLVVGALDETHIPRFSYREVLSVEGEDKAFRAHNLLNGESHGAARMPTTPELDTWDRSWAASGGLANFFELLPKSQFAATHPDWYAGGQVAMMNQEVRATIAQNIVQRLRALPDYRKVWFQVDAMDWGWDMDAASAAFAAAHGNTAAAPRLDMMNDVLRRVQSVLPGAHLSFNAYQWSFDPPTGMSVPADQMVVPMTLQVDYTTALNAGRNLGLGQSIAQWNTLAGRVLVWDHVTNFAGFIQPTPNIYPIGESIRWLASLPNVRGYFAEGSWNTAGGEFASLRAWLIGRLLWNPELDVHGLVKTYCEAYYGADISPYIVQYIDLMHSTALAHKDILGERTSPDAAMYDLAFIRAADKLFDQAEAAAKGDPTLLGRVRAARMGVDYLALLRRQEYQANAVAAGGSWDPDVSNRMARLTATAAAVKLTQYRQSGSVDEMKAILALERKASLPPDYVAGLASSDWREISDLALFRFDAATLVADPLAADGVAARMSGANTVWSIQARLDKLPASGSWDVFADVRVDTVAGQTPTEALRIGTAPPMGQFNSVPLSALSASGYRRVKFPGGPFTNEFSAQRTWYVQAPPGAAIRNIYVDRLVAVRAGLIP